MGQAQFEAAVAAYFREWAERHPVAATAHGIHDHDHRLPEASPAALEAERALVRRFRERVAGIEPASLTRAGRVDREAALYHADLELFRLAPGGLHERAATAPETLGAALYLLFVRDFAPLPRRMESIARRMEAAPRFLAESRALVTRPVRAWNAAALASAEQLPDLLRLIVDTGRDRLADAGLVARLARAADGVRLALRQYADWLRGDVLPAATDDFALGTERFERLLVLRRLGLQADQILALGERHLAELTAFRAALAAKIDRTAPVDAVLRAVKADRPKSFGAALERYRDSVREARAFVAERQVASLPPDESLLVEETPRYLRHLIPYAAYIPPGKFDRQHVGIYLVTPPADPAGMAEHSHAAIGNTTVHEGYPGHHLQLTWAIRHPSVIRTLASGAEFAEGWAHYVEELMQELGFRDALANQLLMVNDLLWRAVRVVLDVKLATGRLSMAEAENALAEVTGMDRAGVAAEVLRYTLTPGQPLSYLVGKHLLQELREEARRRLGPEFTLRAFHDAMLRSGTLPIAILRQALEIELYDPDA
jgi:uncharacterized protein (DUF885 family)